MKSDKVRRVLNRLESSDPDFDDCADAAGLLRELLDTRAALVSAVGFLLNTSVPQTPQQEQCWPGLKRAMEAAMRETP